MSDHDPIPTPEEESVTVDPVASTPPSVVEPTPAAEPPPVSAPAGRSPVSEGRAVGFALVAGLLAAAIGFGAGEALHNSFPPPYHEIDQSPPPTSGEQMGVGSDATRAVEFAPARLSGREFRQMEERRLTIVSRQQTAAAVYGALGGAIGLLLGLAGGLAAGSPARGLIAGVLGAVLAGSASAGLSMLIVPRYYDWAAQMAHAPDADTTAQMLDDPQAVEAGNTSDTLAYPLMMHAAIWGAAGLLGGLAFGIGIGGGAGRIANAMVGGLLGALLATALYVLLGSSIFAMEQPPRPVPDILEARALAHVAAGLLTCLVAGWAAMHLTLTRPKAEPASKPAAPQPA